MQDSSQASHRSVPTGLFQFFGICQAMNIRIYGSLGQAEFHILKHPGLNYKIEWFCHRL